MSSIAAPINGRRVGLSLWCRFVVLTFPRPLGAHINRGAFVVPSVLQEET